MMFSANRGTPQYFSPFKYKRSLMCFQFLVGKTLLEILETELAWPWLIGATLAIAINIHQSSLRPQQKSGRLLCQV
jgi:hypothetical protein